MTAPGNFHPAGETAAQEALGYLNLSNGTPDPRFLKSLNELFRALGSEELPWRAAGKVLRDRLSRLQGHSSAFADTTQAAAVLELTFERALPAYQQFHADLLRHQPEEALFQPMFVGRACAAVLRQGASWIEAERIVPAAIRELNDFLGYRPVAVLNTPQKVEPYPHEWVAPLPLFVRGAGVVVGRYHDLVAQALAILEQTPPEILRQAWFDPTLLDELALDPRAYDFDHPSNKRPNHQFGQWDPHHLDLEGRYRRFVLQGVTLDAIWARTQEGGPLPPEERLFEAGALLAGVTLMAAAVGGQSPETHDSGMTLAKLLPQIAACRDQFYQHLLATVPGSHGERLRTEAAALRQPFGGARQQLNQRLARLRATQLQHVHLAQLFAGMGYAEASNRQAAIVPVASARMICEISGRLTTGHLDLDRGRLTEAAARWPEVEDLLQRAIQCGALVDPWNILGFQGQFSLFAAVENSVRDHRVDVLIHLVREIFRLGARLEAEAAAAGCQPVQDDLSGRLERFGRWWDQFATTEVSGFQSISGREASQSARDVASAVGAWHRAGKAAGDLGFWREHVARFRSPKAYALVVSALVDKGDFVASRALLTQWLSQSDSIRLAEGGYSFHPLAVRWMSDLLASDAAGNYEQVTVEQWKKAAKFFDYLEANADVFWEVPHFEWERAGQVRRQPDADDEDEDDNPFQAAYEDVTYRDSTADGVESETLDGGQPAGEYELDAEVTRLGQRLAFLCTLSRLWNVAAKRTWHLGAQGDRQATLEAWFAQAIANRAKLLELLDTVHRYPLPKPQGGHESLVEYDRRRLLKESMLGQIIATCVETSAAARVIGALAGRPSLPDDLPPWYAVAVPTLAAVWQRDPRGVREAFPALRETLERQPVLYVPLARHGDPRKMFEALDVQHLLLALARSLPRLGMFDETVQVLDTEQAMERHRPDRDGAVTEFDRLFEAAYLAMVECLVDASEQLVDAGQAHQDAELIDSLQRLTDTVVKRWFEHSRSLRLSVLEKVAEKQRWKATVEFIECYGRELFSPRFLNLGNLRAILHQGVEAYLKQWQERDPDPGEEPPLLIRDLGGPLAMSAAVENLTLVIESIVENYAEYKDFNSTTTQSDRGDLLYVLLDFLRLKASYDRFAWQLRPLVMAHEVLVRRGSMSAAELWRRAFAERTAEVADWHLKRLDELVRKHGVRLPTVADRLQEQFTRPLAIDRLRARVRPAAEEARCGQSTDAFEHLEQELAEFTENPTGAGLDVPGWIVALEQEAELASPRRYPSIVEDQPPLAPARLTWEEVRQQLRAWDAGGE